MKKLLLGLITLLAFTLTSFSQSTVPEKDSDSFKWKNGYDEIVEVVFRNFDKDEILSNEVIRKITIQTLVDGEYTLKNKLSYVPVKLTLMPYKGKIVSSLDYRGKNAYGVEKEIQGIWEYDLNGEKLNRLK